MARAAGRIGPNAILQMIPVLERAGFRDEVLRAAGITVLPSGDEMIAEAPAARLHQALRATHPDQAAALAWEAGERTAHYILRHRIPQPVQHLLQLLPWRISARLLARAISKNAWTFAGSGRFTAVTAYLFELQRNPIVAGEHADHPICDWHAAVFETLYRALVHRDMRCVETHCAAQGGNVCRFKLYRA